MGEFAITFDAERAIVEVMISGMWDTAAARRYHAEIVSRAPRSGPFDMIVDIKATTVLPAEAATEVEESLADLARLGLRNAAHVTPSALAAMQVRRIGGAHACMAFFTSRAEALAWLAANKSSLTNQDTTS